MMSPIFLFADIFFFAIFHNKKNCLMMENRKLTLEIKKKDQWVACD